MSKDKDISVIIPVCHGGIFLEEALLSLKAIDYPSERFEALIAAKQEDEESLRIAETETAKSFFQARFLTCPHANRSKLLNEACSEAIGKFFVFGDDSVGKLRFGMVHQNGKAWRISYPGLVPHGGYFDAPDGLVVAHAHGPRNFVMRYEDMSVEGHETLGDNPWIDFSTEAPVLLDQPKPAGFTSVSR